MRDRIMKRLNIALWAFLLPILLGSQAAARFVADNELRRRCPNVVSCYEKQDISCLSHEAEDGAQGCLVDLVVQLEGEGAYQEISDLIQEIMALDKPAATAIVNSRLSGFPPASVQKSQEGVTSWAQFYLGLGADPNYRQQGSFGPLYNCAMTSNVSCVKVLLDSGATIDSAYNEGDSLTLYQELCLFIGSELHRLSSPRRNVRTVSERIDTIRALPERGQSGDLRVFCKTQHAYKDVHWANWPLYLKQRSQEESHQTEGGQ